MARVNKFRSALLHRLQKIEDSKGALDKNLTVSQLNRISNLAKKSGDNRLASSAARSAEGVKMWKPETVKTANLLKEVLQKGKKIFNKPWRKNDLSSKIERVKRNATITKNKVTNKSKPTLKGKDKVGPNSAMHQIDGIKPTSPRGENAFPRDPNLFLENSKKTRQKPFESLGSTKSSTPPLKTKMENIDMKQEPTPGKIAPVSSNTSNKKGPGTNEWKNSKAKEPTTSSLNSDGLKSDKPKMSPAEEAIKETAEKKKKGNTLKYLAGAAGGSIITGAAMSYNNSSSQMNKSAFFLTKLANSNVNSFINSFDWNNTDFTLDQEKFKDPVEKELVHKAIRRQLKRYDEQGRLTEVGKEKLKNNSFDRVERRVDYI